MRRTVIGVLGGILLVLALALPAQAQTTYNTEGPVLQGSELSFACDFGTTFVGGSVELIARYGLPGERSLGRFQMEPLISAEGTAVGGVLTPPRRATYFYATWTCTEPTPA